MSSQPEKQPENSPDAVWDLNPDESELNAFKEQFKRRFVIHICGGLIAAVLLGFAAFSGLYTPEKPAPGFVRVEKVKTLSPVERIRNAMNKPEAGLDTLRRLQDELSGLLNGPLKDDPEALKLYFELTGKIQAGATEK